MVTSIAPKKLGVQQEAISSWQQHGFEVVSFNHATEIEKVRPHFDGVTFVEAKTTAIELYNGFKIPYVSVRSLLNYVWTQGYPCWIANSDVILNANKEKIAYIQRIAQTTLVFGSRIDIEGDELKGKMYEEGFDYFVLQENLDHLFTSRVHMCIGQPWWDFWVPITCIRKGVQPVKCQEGIVYHRKHETVWDVDQLYFFGKMLAKEIGTPDFNRSDLPKFSEMIWNHITEQSKTLMFKKTNGKETKSNSTDG